jgi:large subunit ribosomal protein L29
MKIGEVRQYRAKLRTLSAAELGDELLKLRKEQFSLRMQRATGQQPKPAQFGDARRNVARVKTALRQQRAAQAGGKSK